MADLEAVLADVSYLMAMEKSKSSINSTKNGRRLTLPDRDSANVIQRYLEERGELSFEKVFEEKIGYALFVSFCSKKHAFSVPIVFYQQIEGNSYSQNLFNAVNGYFGKIFYKKKFNK
jgi:beta-adrenergic-receptor kinase